MLIARFLCVICALIADASPCFNGKKLELTNAEWKERLTPMEYEVLREGATERAYSGKYDAFWEPGIYLCAGCQLPLFSSKAKYNSETGWPSFWEPICPENVMLEKEGILFFTRMEVRCARCGGHLGHVFDDGPPPTEKRYCMNSAALQFEPIPHK